MSSKFRISKLRQKDNLHLRLAGDFNDVSICELLDVLKDNCVGTNEVFIHTDQLERVSISGIGRDVFKRNLSYLSSSSIHVRFPEMSDNPFEMAAM